MYTPTWQDTQTFRLAAPDRLMLLGYEKLGIASTVLAGALARLVCHPRLDGLYATTAAMVRYEKRLTDVASAAFADRPGAGDVAWHGIAMGCGIFCGMVWCGMKKQAVACVIVG